MEAHNRTVAAISSRVRQFYETKKPFRLYHGATNSTRPSQRHADNIVDVSLLNHVLSVDAPAKVVTVEPNVPMDALVEATLPYGLVPPVVMEFPGITVGGGFAGTGCESSSFRYGYFDRIVNEVEIVLANGEVKRASKSENTDLFYGAACGFGTLGIVTLLVVQLIDAPAMVENTYYRVNSIAEAVSKFEEATKDESVEFLDGIMFAKDHGVICAGRRTDSPSNGRVQRFSRAKDSWYYLHAQDKSKGPVDQRTDDVPLIDYLFRYNRGAFWCGRWAYRYFLLPFNTLTRWMLDFFMQTRIMYSALHLSGQSHTWIIQDCVIPYGNAEDFLEYVDKTFKCYPLWLCPIKQQGKDPDSPWGLLAQTPQRSKEEMMLNFGIYTGIARRSYKEFIEANRALERKTFECGGEKWLYAHTFYTEEEFWKLMDKGEYDVLREKYHAEHLPSIYDKVKIDTGSKETFLQSGWKGRLRRSWPLSGLYGVIKATLQQEYLLSQDKNFQPELGLDARSPKKG